MGCNKNLPFQGYNNELLNDLKKIQRTYIVLNSLKKINALNKEDRMLFTLLELIETFKEIPIINSWWTGEYKSSNRTSFYRKLESEAKPYCFKKDRIIFLIQIYFDI